MGDVFLVYNSSLTNFDENCWSELAPVDGNDDASAAAEFDADYLQKIHIITVFVVCLCGSSLILLLLICACLSSETVIKVVLKRRVKLPHKGIEGQFQFLLSSNSKQLMKTSKSDVTTVNSDSVNDVMETRVSVEVEPDALDTGGLLSGHNGMFGFTPPRRRTDTMATCTSAGDASLVSVMIDDTNDVTVPTTESACAADEHAAYASDAAHTSPAGAERACLVLSADNDNVSTGDQAASDGLLSGHEDTTDVERETYI